MLRKMSRTAGLACGAVVALATLAALAQAPSREAAVPSIAGRSLYAVQSLSDLVPVLPLYNETPEARLEADALWHRLWADDRATISRLGLEAVRNGPVLSLKLDGERLIRFVDEVGACGGLFSCLAHSLQGYIAEHRHYVLQVRHGEGGWAYLVSQRNGTVQEIAAPPLFAEDSRLAIAWQPSMMDAPRLEVIRFEDGAAIIEPATIEEPCWLQIGGESLQPFALDADNILLVRRLAGAAEALPGLALKRIEGHWQLVCEP